MTQQAMLEELEAVAARLAVKVSYEALAASVGSGGLCRVHGAYRVIIDKRAQVGERLAALAQALGQLPAVSAQWTGARAGEAGEAVGAATGEAVGAATGEAAGSIQEMSAPVRDLLRHYALRRAS